MEKVMSGPEMAVVLLMASGAFVLFTIAVMIWVLIWKGMSKK